MTTNQRIGFGKKIRLDWLIVALRSRARSIPFPDVCDELSLLIAETNPGRVAISKALSNIRQVVFEPIPVCADFAERGVTLYRQNGAIAALPVLWGLSITSYSFFSQTASTIGRLLRLQEQFSAHEMVRRLTERVGDRRYVDRVARYNLSSLINWGILRYTLSDKMYRFSTFQYINDAETVAWLYEALLRSIDRSALPIQQVLAHPMLFPFKIEAPASAKIVKANSNLVINRQNLDDEHLSLASSAGNDPNLI